MPVGLGPRFLIEAGFIIAVAVVAGVERLQTTTIVIVVGAAWLLVAAVEFFTALARKRGLSPPPSAPELRQPTAFAPPPVGLEPELALSSEPEPPPVEQPPVPVPVPVPSQPRVMAVPSPPPPEPEPEPVRLPAPEPDVVSLASRRSGPREWNVWELERIARDRAGDDVGLDEERSFLLLYLREFANPDGLLPADFDSVVRESFGDVLDAAYS